MSDCKCSGDKAQAALDSLWKENDANLENKTDKYAQGYHDALLDVAQALGLDTGGRVHFD